MALPVASAGEGHHVNWYVRQLSFLAVGAVCLGLQLICLAALIRLHVDRGAANAISFVIGAEVKFGLSSYLVWGDRFKPGASWRRFISFNVTTAVVFFVDAAVFAATDSALGSVPAAVIGVGVGTIVSYLACDHIVFRHWPAATESVAPAGALSDSRPAGDGQAGLDNGSRLTSANRRARLWHGSRLTSANRRARLWHGSRLTSADPHAPARLWLIVPAYNEEARLGPTLAQYRRALSARDRLVIVVNGSQDRTEEVARQAAAEDERLDVIVDEREIGKGGALLAGYRYVHDRADAGDVVAYTDADAAVAGSEILRFCRGLSPGELRVGSRWQDAGSQIRRQPIARQMAGRAFNWCVRTALRVQVKDTQCGAKALHAKCLPGLLSRLDSTGFAFDVDLILSARAQGLAVKEVPVRWTDQEGSTVSMRRAAPAMMRDVIRLRRKYRAVTEAGRVVLSPSNRRQVLSARQKVVIVALMGAVTAGLIVAPSASLVVLSATITIFFAAANLVKLDLIRQGTRDRRGVVDDFSVLSRLPDERLPMYTILLPLYREVSILGQLIDGILALDYPQTKLDVKLLLEHDDVATRQAVAERTLPPCFEVVIVPDDGPAGKPRACNAGLAQAKGAYLVIYDAEDRPEPDQLRKAVDAFASAPDSVVCMQAKLNYFNRTQNLLTRWFTAEYSLWFDQLLPGLQAMDVAIPLGGTSNHFLTSKLRQLGGWDAFNVTEDADLGIRIYLSGWKTAMLNSTTYEEATSRCRNWVRQRSRWVKGYMYTYLRQMSHPISLFRQMGPTAYVMLQLFFGAATLCLLINPVYWFMTVAWFAGHYHFIQLLFPRLLLYLGIVGLFVGNAAFTLAAVSGAYGRRNYEDVKWALLVPFYWILMSVAAWKALIQLFYKPSYWEKTVHGHCLYTPEINLAATEGHVGG